ncbi:OmpH family outer membrane protein [Sphingomonas sp. HDW15A]|uniref:OmpH family outer membrane protein n=1 Tax=Sphingomonas sp. HDW15A TaxID=2714942 RepID=UPI00140738E6|nr:OmpH family outer membrane protein [Sphingomonas sp. HDW15A]QIK96048.1 OmpH family outer membrane protein [Sphingomonas sp. HDW15A]
MRKLITTLTLAGAAIIASAPLQAQSATVLTVDTDRILAECTACKSASSQIQSQITSARQRAQALEGQLRTEAQGLEAQVKALNGRQPDAALQQKITAFQTKQNQARTELGNRERQIESIQAHVQQQIGTRVVQIAEQVRARRQASVVMAKGSLMAVDPRADVTGDVLAALNQQLPSVSVTPLPQQQQSSTSGR